MDEISPLEPTIPGAIWRYKWLIALIVTLGAAIGVAVSTASSPSFTAKASLVVEDPGAIGVFDSSFTNRSERYVADQVEILDSPAVEARAEALVLAERPNFAGKIEDMASILGDTESSLIRIQVASPFRSEAQLVANSLVAAYQQIKEETAVASAESALAELDRTLSDVDAELAGIQAAIADARTGRQVRSELDVQFAQAIARIVELQAELEGNPSEARSEQIRAELADLQIQVQTYQEIQVAETTNPELSPLLQSLTNTLNRRAGLQTRRDEIAVDSQLASRGIALASFAELPEGDGRQQVRAGIVGGILGLAIGIAAAYALSIRRRSFDDRSEPELLLEAPIISEVPHFAEEGLTTKLPVRDEPASRTAEAFRFAATAIDVQSAATGAKSIVAISAAGGEGKTTLLANTAIASAREGNRVLVIDADFGSQSLTNLLIGNERPPNGITEVVETGMPLRRAAVNVPVADGANLSLLSRGQRPVIAPNFFRSAATRVFFEAARDDFELVLIDAPPFLHVAYSNILARYADAAIVIVNHGGSVSELEEVADRLDFIGTPPIGYVYNQAPLRLDHETGGSVLDILGTGELAGQSKNGKSRAGTRRFRIRS